ncbi:MAG TPA: hypothetical protein VFK16_11590 [Gemmatimonadaceae bacterium]|nr:hypothetical protein [Gemmatimonadaceae bacterium]
MARSFTTALFLALGLIFVVAVAPALWRSVGLALGLRRERHVRRVNRPPDLAAARRYHDLLVETGHAAGIDDRTWSDLDMDDVFCALDFTESEPGRQYLYRMLRVPAQTAPALEELDAMVHRLSSPGSLVDDIRAALHRLRDVRAGRLVNLILDDLPARPVVWPLFPFLTAAAMACLLLALVWPAAAFAWIGVCVVNVIMEAGFKTRLRRFAPAVHQMPVFLRAARALGGADVPELAERRRVLASGARDLRPLEASTRWLRFDSGQAGEFLGAMYEYVNLLFLLDLNAFVFSVEKVRASRLRLREMFEAIGYLDAAQAIAAWRATRPRWAVPTFTASAKRFTVTDVVHPLLEHPVANSLVIQGHSVLVSGSNLSGKTTFVRTLGVNAILAQSLATVCAAAYRAPFLRVRTSIGRDDSLAEGKSYYLAEVESVLALISAKDDGHQHLFLLDETFRGTNTTERVAAAFAVLKHLNQGLDIVVVATHDLEVLDLLGEAYTPVHFREQVVNDELTFDYLLHPGRSSTHNAIALLRFMRYPAQVVDDATAALDWQRRLGQPRASGPDPGTDSP